LIGTLRIFYNRWAEVLLVIVFSGGALLLFNEFAGSEKISESSMMLMGLGTGAFLVFGYLMQLGFLRTAFLEGETRQEPKILITTGARFLWRVMLAGIVIFVLVFMMSQIIFSIVYSQFGEGDTSKIDMEKVPMWMMYVSVYGAMFLLIKPVVFVPAIIVVFDCKVREVIGYLKIFRIFRAGQVWGWILLMVIFNAGIYGVKKMLGLEEFDNVFVNAVLIFISALLAFGMQMEAINYIKDQKSKLRSPLMADKKNNPQLKTGG
jgi:hypothetical protein